MTKEELIKFLKENLTISVSDDNGVSVNLYICDELIASANSNDGKHSEGWYWT